MRPLRGHFAGVYPTPRGHASLQNLRSRSLRSRTKPKSFTRLLCDYCAGAHSSYTGTQNCVRTHISWLHFSVPTKLRTHNIMRGPGAQYFCAGARLGKRVIQDGYRSGQIRVSKCSGRVWVGLGHFGFRVNKLSGRVGYRVNTLGQLWVGSN